MMDDRICQQYNPIRVEKDFHDVPTNVVFDVPLVYRLPMVDLW